MKNRRIIVECDNDAIKGSHIYQFATMIEDYD